MRRAEKLKKELGHAIELVQSVHDEMMKKFTSSSVPSEIMLQALEITGQIAALKWYLEYISEEVRS